MAQIKPFGALRFTEAAGPIAELCCPPYDIISEQERLAYIERNPHNIIRLELPREGEDPYAEAGKVLRDWLSGGILATDSKDCYYIYGEQFEVAGKQYSFKGIIARVHLEPFSAGIVLPHEETLSKAKADRFNLMQATDSNFSQIYSLYRDGADTERLIEQLTVGQPEQSFVHDSVTHSLWTVSDTDAIAAITEQFANRQLFIADGHHRYETALNYRNHLRQEGLAVEGDGCDWCMMMLVSMQSSGLVVFPTHRIIRSADADAVSRLAEGSCELFSCEHFDNRTAAEAALDDCYTCGKAAFLLYFERKYTLLTLRDKAVMAERLPQAGDALRGLDVSILHTLLLEDELGIDREDMANQRSLSYTRSADEAVEAVDSGEAVCSFIINPTRVEEISAVAAAGEKMPQKSTYFYPKLITGLVMNKLR